MHTTTKISPIEQRVLITRGGTISPRAARKVLESRKRRRPRREAPARTVQGRREQLDRAEALL